MSLRRIKETGGEVRSAGTGIVRAPETAGQEINSHHSEKWERKKTIRSKKRTNTRIHGKYDEVNQRRTQESQTRIPEETQSGKAAQAPRLRTWIEKAQSQETGPRTGEAVDGTLLKHLAFGRWRSCDPQGRQLTGCRALMAEI